MKIEKGFTCLSGIVLSLMAAAGGVGCLVTAFFLDSVPVSLLAWVFVLWAVFACVCFSFRRGGLVLLAVSALVLGYLIREGTLVLELESLLYRISVIYNNAYNWGILRWSGAELTRVPVTGGLVLVGVTIITLVSRTVCRQKMLLPAAAAAFLPLAACFVVTDTIPGNLWLFLLIGALGILLLTQAVRHRSAADGLRLTALLMIPVLLASMLLLRLAPRESYEQRANSLQQTLLSWVQKLPFVVETPSGELTVSIDGSTGSQVNLASVGPKTRMRYAVMDVVADTGQLLYLRGQSFDVYTGQSWEISEYATGDDPFWPTAIMEAGTVRVTTRAPRSLRYIPYYLQRNQYTFANGTVANPGKETGYEYAQLSTVLLYKSELYAPYKDSPLAQQCLSLPQDTLRRAQPILWQILKGGDLTQKDTVERILNYVRSSAAYDLDTPRMPDEESDFALWFLEESDTGYCVHFATAATVLLRTAGIPARYVTGYTVWVDSGIRKTVTADKAHAWVEYLDTQRGWLILDPTPEVGIDQPETEPSTEPTENTVFIPPVVPTEPTETTEATEPTETEAPTGASETTEPTQTQPGTSPLPGASGDGGGDRSVLPPVLTVLACAVGIPGAAALQYFLRIRFRRRRMGKGNPNRQGLYRWQLVRYYGRAVGLTQPPELEELAEKAAFSQHTLTAEELAQFDHWLEQARQTLNRHPFLPRVLLRLIFAIE